MINNVYFHFMISSVCVRRGLFAVRPEMYCAHRKNALWGITKVLSSLALKHPEISIPPLSLHHKLNHGKFVTRNCPSNHDIQLMDLIDEDFVLVHKTPSSRGSRSYTQAYRNVLPCPIENGQASYEIDHIRGICLVNNMQFLGAGAGNSCQLDFTRYSQKEHYSHSRVHDNTSNSCPIDALFCSDYHM